MGLLWHFLSVVSSVCKLVMFIWNLLMAINGSRSMNGLRVTAECRFAEVLLFFSVPRRCSEYLSLPPKSDASHMILMWIITLLRKYANRAIYLPRINSKFPIFRARLTDFFFIFFISMVTFEISYQEANCLGNILIFCLGRLGCEKPSVGNSVRSFGK